MKKINFLLLVLMVFYGQAQTISGMVISKEENIPVSYARIGVEKENTGVISDKNGNFSIDLSKSDRSATVKIEVAGYETYTETVRAFSELNAQKIYLKEKVKNIQEVKITPKKLVDKNWGVNTKTKHVMYSVNPGFNGNNFLGETALEFSTNKRAKIKNIHLNIASYQSDGPVIMRYSIYDENNGLPGNSILNDEIIVELTADKIKAGNFTLDVNDRNIWVHGTFFIGIQFLKKFEGKINISATLFRAGFVR